MIEFNIPRVIHYCWFGNGEKPDYVVKYIQTWKAKLPDYEIIEWNESNFDINYCNFTAEAYSLKKFAFVSDVARLYALYNYGGFYLDTDVKVLKSFDDLIKGKKCIFGFEVENRIATSFMAATKNNEFINEFLESYKQKRFIYENGRLNITPNVEYLTNLLKEKGLKENGEYQVLEDLIFVYPLEYFSPYDYINCVDDSTKQTYCIHYFAVSWLNGNVIFKRKIKSILVKLIGKNRLINFRRIKNKIRLNKKKGKDV